MIQLDQEIIEYLKHRTKQIVRVVEFYPRDTEDLSSISAPEKAIGRFSDICYEWVTSAGTWEYDGKVSGFPSIQTYITGELNNAEITFSNVQRGEGSMARFVLDNHIKGCWMVIRLIFPELKDKSHVLFWGKCDRPGGINTKELSISSTQDLGNTKQQIPFRNYGANCPLEFAKGGCLGNETLEQKSLEYRAAVEDYGTGGCNKLYSTCAKLNNTRFFQGQRAVAVSGQFSYVTVEEVVKRVLFWTKRKKVRTVKTDNWSSVNQSEGEEVVPIAFGRCQIEGHPFAWADVGEQVRALYGFCEGKISAFTFTRSRVEGISIVSAIEHHGDWGLEGDQFNDTLFGGVSGSHSKLAYQEITTNGSSPTQVDDAPLITSVIRGLEVPVPDADGNYTLTEWTNNPVHITRFCLTDRRFGRIPEHRMDDEANYLTALDCDEIVEDRTNSEVILLPANEYGQYGDTYRRFRSSGRYTAYKDAYLHGENPQFRASTMTNNLLPPMPESGYPEFEEPRIRWFNPFQPYTIPPPENVLRQKFTCNGALQEEVSILDFLFNRVMPTFKGFINYAPNCKIQIKNRRKADNGYLRSDVDRHQKRIPITNVAPWRNSLDGYVVIGVSLQEAEVRKVTGIEYSQACNGIPITVETSGGVTAIGSVIKGGTASTPGMGTIRIGRDSSQPGDNLMPAPLPPEPCNDGDCPEPPFPGGGGGGPYPTPAFVAKIKVTIGSGEDAYSIEYSADGIESLSGFTRMVVAYLNANIQINSFLTAYVNPGDPTLIHLRCESGYLVLDDYTEYPHSIGEEVLRVQAVFENCGELTANKSARFDNIIKDSFKWNENNTEEVNAITAKYTSAVDDFRSTILMPRAAWDTIDLEGELSKDELDLTFVDNYWQAGYLAKGEAIDRIDGNIHFAFDTNLEAIRLELGDVVAVRHDSGDGALNYVPVWVTDIKTNLDKFIVNIGAKLYLTAAFDYHVQPIDALLTTTLNATEQPTQTPTEVGTSGGVSTSPEPNVPRPDHKYYEQFRGLGRYSPNGLDVV